MAEFKALRKTAKNQDIFLIPGVEISVNDGANGIHTLVAFSEQWLKNGKILGWYFRSDYAKTALKPGHRPARRAAYFFIWF